MEENKYEEILNNVVKNIVGAYKGKSTPELVNLLYNIGFGMDAKDCLKLYYENKKREVEDYFNAQINAINDVKLLSDKSTDVAKDVVNNDVKDDVDHGDVNPVYVEDKGEKDDTKDEDNVVEIQEEVSADDLFEDVKDHGPINPAYNNVKNENDETPPIEDSSQMELSEENKEERMLTDEEILAELFGEDSQ